MRRGRIVYLWEMWHYFNKRYFGGKLIPPKAIRLTSAQSYDGVFVYKGSRSKTSFHLKDATKIMLSAHLNERRLMGALLHEMVHQYQFQVLEVEPLHDMVFNCYCRWIERQTKFPLRTGS